MIKGDYFKCFSHRPTSIKTRIETKGPLKQVNKKISHRPTSIKTRIETKGNDRTYYSICRLTDQLPLKQGLKHNRFNRHTDP